MNCDFCNIEITPEVIAIKGLADTFICASCAEKAAKLLKETKQKKTTEAVQEETLIPEKIKVYLDEYVIGQEKAKQTLSVALYNHYKRLRNTDLADTVELDKSNILLIGPTGSGKTYLIKMLAKLFDVPFTIADANSITQAGYVGEDAETMLQRLIQEANGDIKKAERGIIFIDEIDKITRKGENASITRDVSGEGVQQALLKILEGNLVNVQTTGQRKNPHGECWQIDTSKILFICGGSFEGIETIVNKRLNTEIGIGFGREVAAKKDLEIGEAILKVTTEDLRKFGMIPEFLGRVPVITALQQLNLEALLKIIVEPKNSIYKQYQTLFKMDGIELDITQAGLECIAKEALKQKTGARGLRGIMETVLLPYMYVAPSSSQKKFKLTEEDILHILEQNTLTDNDGIIQVKKKGVAKKQRA